MTTQFVHLETYGRFPKKGAKRHETVSGILGEASRRPSSSLHIAAARPPVRLFGDDPLDVMGRIDALAKQARDSAGRRLRSDAGLLVAAVISYPMSWTEIENAEQQLRYLDWRDKTQRWLLATFGDALTAIVEHADERYPHLHAFLVPGLTANSQLEWNNVHPGRAAKIASAGRLESPAAQDAAYMSAMTALADDYYHAVSCRFAHARVSVRRDRRSRRHHLEVAELESQKAALKKKLDEVSLELSRLRHANSSDQVSDIENGAPTPLLPPHIDAQPGAFATTLDTPDHTGAATGLENDDGPLPDDDNIERFAYDGNDDPNIIDADSNQHDDDGDHDDGHDEYGQDDLTWQDTDFEPHED